MLKVVIQEEEVFDSKTSKFETLPSVELLFEHSLLSVSKWESIHEKAFLGRQEKTREEIFSYIKCMCLTPDVPEKVFARLNSAEYTKIQNYISSKQSATHFTELQNGPNSRETITSELIYYWMTSFQIPFECENWNLNRLMTLIRICGIKSTPPKKMSRSATLARNRSINNQRLAALNTRG